MNYIKHNYNLMYSIKIVILVIFIICINQAHAQVSYGGVPATFFPEDFSDGTVNNIITEIIMPITDNTALLQEDSLANLSDTLNQWPQRFAKNIPTDVELSAWTFDTLTNGDGIYRLKITSTGAKSIHLYYDDFFLAYGAELYIYSAEYPDSVGIGAFTNLNNSENGKFATGLVSSESCILELYEPKDEKGNSRIHITELGHAYRDFKTQLENCHINVACSQGDNWRDQIRSVVYILLKTGGGYGYSFSGAMINNCEQDGTPYLLTAFHNIDTKRDCIIDKEEENMLSSAIVYFNYEGESCTSTTGTKTQSITGLKLINKGVETDFALLKLTENPPTSYNIFLAGFDFSGNVPASGVCIHHPDGSIKKISIEEDPLVATSSGESGADFPDCVNNSNLYWEAQFNNDPFDASNGIVESGSSGAPFFDENGRVVGQLRGAQFKKNAGNCTGSNTTGKAWFGQFSASWPREGLSRNLNPNGSCVSSFIDGIDYKNTSTGEAEFEIEVSFTFSSGECRDKNKTFKRNFVGKWNKYLYSGYVKTEGDVKIKEGFNLWRAGTNKSNIFWGSETYIELNPGFEVEEGNLFAASIIDCDNLELGKWNDYTDNQTTNNNFTEEKDTIQILSVQTTFTLHPNPSDGNFELQINNYESGVNNAVIIYDPLGREIYQSQILSPQTEINLSSQRQGLYVVKVVLGEEAWWEKMVVR